MNMGQLKQLFETAGFTQVKTILNSGNVVFQSSSESEDIVGEKISKMLFEVLGYKISVLVRSVDHLKNLVHIDPFQGHEVTKQTRLYVSFLTEKPTTSLKLPYRSDIGDFEIVSVLEREVCSILTLSEEFTSTESMNVLEKTFGKQITTRNWNTVLRIVKLFP